MDVIKADPAGLKQVVAMGTQISQEHVAFIKKVND